ncbi:TPA: hypothetical protein ACG5DM_006297, partial [Pseudomonas putida]
KKPQSSLHQARRLIHNRVPMFRTEPKDLIQIGAYILDPDIIAQIHHPIVRNSPIEIVVTSSIPLLIENSPRTAKPSNITKPSFAPDPITQLTAGLFH